VTTTSAAKPSAELGDAVLLRLAAIADQFGAEYTSGDARSVAERVAEGRFYVACVGQFKRGKSTLINALIGASVLPAGVVPVTTVPTVIRHGDHRRARIRFQTKGWSAIPLDKLDEYVSEDKNPENAKAVVGVEVFFPSPLLASGMCFVDTPGLGSVFAGNTAATHDFIPHIDAAIIVIGADPPISGDELAIVETVAKQVSNLLFVLNKADRVNQGELATATAFARRVLEKQLKQPVSVIFEASAAEQIEKRGSGRDWNKLVAALQELVEKSGSNLVRESAQRAMARTAEQLLRIVAEERQALRRPVEESERRIAQLRETLMQAERSMRELGYLFTAEQHHLSDMFGDRRRAFLAKVQPEARQELDQVFHGLPRKSGPAFRRELMHAAQQIAKERLLPWLEREEHDAERAYRAVAQRFVEFANEFLNRLATTGVPELAQLPHALDPEKGFRARSEFHFNLLERIAAPASPLRLVADFALGTVRAYDPFQRDAQQFLDQLLEWNSARVRGDVDNRVLESRHWLEAEIRILLREVTAVAERALNHARRLQADGAAAVDNALARLDALEAEIRSLATSSATALTL
jgi:GTPase Era involved in 16S rRNA processing